MNRLILLLFIAISINAKAQLIDIISSLDDPTSIAIHGDDLYISELDKVTKIDLTDPNPVPIEVLTGFIGPSQLLIDKDNLYIGIYAGGKIVKMDLSLDNPIPVDVVTNVYGTNGLVLKGDILYIAESTEDKISTVDLSQDNPVATDFITNLDFPNALFIKDNDLYFIEVGDDKISKVDLSQSPPSPVDVVTDLDDPSLGLVINEDEMYFSQYGGDRISKININDANPTITDVFTGLNGPTQLLIEGNDMYVAVRLEDKVSKIEKLIGTMTSDVDHMSTPKISIYPNPSSNSISIDGLDKIQTGTLFNTAGIKIKDFIARENQILDLQNLEAGIYYLVFENGLTQKIVKK